ncbi:MAG: sodium:proton exchanger [Eggerthellaceae bacterium]|nr:sodium:proton exchanger [Eggerthellaceae bacterium]
METLTLVLLLAIAVLISAVIDQIVPRVSLPLIQVAMGIVIALFSRGSIVIELEPDLFLVLFIAPLLYIEAKNADKAILWRNRGPILSLAVGLVVVTMLIIGFVLNAVLPTISLAAAFALGAALGPTDAVAVSSLSKQVNIPERQWGVLKGELLLNDASGIVCFQFAIAAAATGAFSLLEAGESFIVEFIGGLLFGLAIGYLANWVLRRIRSIGIESTTFHVLFEICIPFIVYLAAQAIHVSGIIAVVVAGLVNVIAPRTVSPSVSHMNIVSSNVWEVIAFTLNGIVFLLLGTQIPTAMLYSWGDASISNLTLIALVALVTFLLMGTRFIWCTIMELSHTKHDKGRFTKRNLRNALIVTLCGAKGTITLSILFTIPIFLASGVRFPERHLIIFIGCGVILCTLLLATFVVPLVAPKRERKKSEIQERQNYFECLADILRNVIEEITALQTRENLTATRRVIQIYQDRLQETKNMTGADTSQDVELRCDALEWEQERTLALIEEGVVSHDIGYEYIGRLEKMERFARHREKNLSVRHLAIAVRMLILRTRQKLAKVVPNPMQHDDMEEMRALQMETHSYVVDILHKMIQEDDVRTEDVSRLLVEYETTLAQLRRRAPSVTTTFKIVDQTDDLRRLAYQIELEQIQKMYERNRIDRQAAKNMRDNVHLMQMDLDDRI